MIQRYSDILTLILENLIIFALVVLLATLFSYYTHTTDVVPSEIQMPGARANEISTIESPDKRNNNEATTGHNSATASGVFTKDTTSTGFSLQ